MRRLTPLATALILAAGAAAAQTDSDSTSGSAFVQDGMGVSGASSTSNSGSQNEVVNDAQAMSGGNVFDFSNRSPSRFQPPPPGLPSFGGGPCIGPGYGGAAAFGGISFGLGASTIDEACTRRNWIQTIIGASQHMGPNDAALLKRLAFEVMRDDPMLAPALERIGIARVQPARSTVPISFDAAPEEQVGAQLQPAARAVPQAPAVMPRTNGLPENPADLLPPDTTIPDPAPPQPAVPQPASVPVRPERDASRIAVRADTCSVIVSRSAPAGFARAVGGRGCRVVTR